jgi:cytochrome c5
MRRILSVAGWMVCCLAAAGWAQSMAAPTAAAKQGPTAAQKQPVKAASSAEDQAGERKFQQNCNRCHNAPQELGPRVTGAVLLHMRVRASLSADDEKAILRYMGQ